MEVVGAEGTPVRACWHAPMMTEEVSFQDIPDALTRLAECRVVGKLVARLGFS